MEIENTINNIYDKLESWVASFLTNLPNIAIAVIVVIIFAFLGRYIKKLAAKVLLKTSSNPAISRLGSSLVYVGVVIAGIFVALSVVHLDKTVTSLLAGAGIIGLALSFAFQDVASNFISGIFLSVNRPIKIGDQIKTNDMHGIVKNINFRSTILETFQGQTLTIPNRMIYENPIENISRNGSRRIDLEVGVSYGEDLEKVERIAENSLKGLDSVLQTNDVRVIYTGFGGSSINFKLMYWCCVNDEPGYLQALTDGVKAIKKAFDKESISIPYPIRTLDFGIKGGKMLSESLNQIDWGETRPNGEEKTS